MILPFHSESSPFKALPKRNFKAHPPSPRWQLPPLRWGRRMYLPREVTWDELRGFHSKNETKKKRMNHEILDIFHVRGFHLRCLTILPDGQIPTKPSKCPREKAYRLTQHVLTGWSPWYDGPCADDTGSWLQPSSVIMAMSSTWDSTAQLHVCRSQDYWMQQMKPWQPAACRFFSEQTKNLNIPSHERHQPWQDIWVDDPKAEHCDGLQDWIAMA